jgi:hypothetical protein
MSTSISRRLAELEARQTVRPRSFVIMPWDIVPETKPDDLVLEYHILEPGAVPGGPRIPYERTGVHPAQDNPGSVNAQLHRDSESAAIWSSRKLPNGTTLQLPHNGREPLEGGRHA